MAMDKLKREKCFQDVSTALKHVAWAVGDLSRAETGMHLGGLDFKGPDDDFLGEALEEVSRAMEALAGARELLVEAVASPIDEATAC